MIEAVLIMACFNSRRKTNFLSSVLIVDCIAINVGRFFDCDDFNMGKTGNNGFVFSLFQLEGTV